MKLIYNTFDMKKILYVILLLTVHILKGQTNNNPDFTLAKVGERIDGVYMFLNCEPANSYEYVATIEAKLTWYGSNLTLEEQFRKIIKTSKRQYANFNGMIFRGNNFRRVELIKFHALEASMSGVSFKDKVSFIKDNEEYTGEVIELIPKNNTVRVKYRNIFDDQEIRILNVQSVMPLTQEQYIENINKFNERVEMFKFEVGDSVSWIQNKKLMRGTVIKLNAKNHIASVKFIDDNGVEKIATVRYLSLQKSSQ